MANKDLTKTDVALGGKIRCNGCGGEWWLSGPQAEYHRVNGWPTKCGNHPDVPGTGSGTHCTEESEMEFLLYDIDENERILTEHGHHEAVRGIRPQAAKLLIDAGMPVADALKKAKVKHADIEAYFGAETAAQIVGDA